MGTDQEPAAGRAESPSIALRVFVLVFATLLLGAALAPIARPLYEDSFPFSTYPMFSRPLARVVSLTHAVGVDAQGRRHPLEPWVSSRSHEVLQSQAVLVHATISGTADVECRKIARRVAEDEDLRAIRAVEIATDAFDVIAYFDADRREPERRLVHARCEVAR